MLRRKVAYIEVLSVDLIMLGKIEVLLCHKDALCGAVSVTTAANSVEGVEPSRKYDIPRKRYS